MKEVKVRVKKRGREIVVPAKKTGFFTMGIGLTFHCRNTSNLLFDFRTERRFSITSFFVFFSFMAVWLDSRNNVIETKLVRPFRFRIRPKKPFRRLLEIPVNERNATLVSALSKEKFK